MSATIIIEKLDIGYIVTGGSPQSKRACLSIQEALQAALFWSEGLSEHFGGMSYGKVIVERAPAESMTDSGASAAVEKARGFDTNQQEQKR